jgi:pyridoxal phosphate enzyme (YggS family)
LREAALMDRSVPPPDASPGRSDPGAPRGDVRLERLRENLTGVYDRIEAARRRSPRSAPVVNLVVVTKAAPAGAFDALRALGERDVGENRAPDAFKKRESAPIGLVWHGIGHLQTNKIKKATGAFDVFHAIDSLPLAEALDAALGAAGRRWPAYAQVNAARDPNKGGIAPEQALTFLEALSRLENLDVVGWMTMAREEDEGERARPCFAVLRELRDEALRRGAGRVRPEGLSMGMSGDFEVAVEEGATIVRVGRAVWDGVSSRAQTPMPDASPRPAPAGPPARGQGPDSRGTFEASERSVPPPRTR